MLNGWWEIKALLCWQAKLTGYFCSCWQPAWQRISPINTTAAPSRKLCTHNIAELAELWLLYHYLSISYQSNVPKSSSSLSRSSLAIHRGYSDRDGQFHHYNGGIIDSKSENFNWHICLFQDGTTSFFFQPMAWEKLLLMVVSDKIKGCLLD